jgi:hypothetical protein
MFLVTFQHPSWSAYVRDWLINIRITKSTELAELAASAEPLD